MLLAISRSSQCSTTGVTHAWNGPYKRSLAANPSAANKPWQWVSCLATRVVLCYMYDAIQSSASIKCVECIGVNPIVDDSLL